MSDKNKELPALKSICLAYRDIYYSLPEQRRQEVDFLVLEIRQAINRQGDRDLATMAVAHVWSEITLLQIGKAEN